jgi:hypothetical protein
MRKYNKGAGVQTELGNQTTKLLKMSDKFNYVIARRWYEDSNELCCYVYHNAIFYGNMEDAISTRDFIRGRGDGHKEEYEIYKIEDKFLKID